MQTAHIANTSLNIIDSVFGVVETVSEFDYVDLGEKVIAVIAAAAAIIVGVITYCSTALQLFWLEHGERIMTNSVRAVILTADFAGNCYYAGRDCRPVINRWVAQLADRVYFTAIA